MAKRRENLFAGKARKSMDKPRSAFGYLNVPEDVEVFKPEPDTEIVIDIIPYTVSDPKHLDNQTHEDVAVVGDPHWKRPIKVHKGVGPDNLSLICPTTIGEKCPMCEYFTERKRAGDDFDDIRDLLPSYRTLYVIIPLDVRECEVDYKEGEIYIMEQPDHYFGKALQSAMDKDITAEGFADPEFGLSLQVDFRVGKFGKVEFAEAIKVKFVEREEQYEFDIIDEAPDLDKMMKILPYKEFKALLHGDMGDVDDEDMDDRQLEEERPRRERRTSTRERKTTGRERSTRKPKDEEPQEEKKPRGRRSSETDEEPEEKPSRSRKATKQKCPFGHRFGIDHDEFEDCDKCNIWEDCKDDNSE
jgi:hypothetical protein